MKLNPGRRVLLNTEWYLISKFIDKGNFSCVYKVAKVSTGDFFALKIMKPIFSERRFVKEIECMKTLDHPNVVKFHESGLMLGLRFILMEYVDGIDLFGWIINHPKVKSSQFDHIIKQLFDTLDYIHKNNIVHRDVKTENVLCTDSEYPEIKIADFGLATITNGRLLHDFCGSPFYVAPEMIKHRPYSFEVDVWGLGIVGYILRLGFFPICVDEMEKVLEIIDAEEYFKEDYFEFLPKSERMLLRGLLARDPKKRFTISEAKQFWIENK